MNGLATMSEGCLFTRIPNAGRLRPVQLAGAGSGPNRSAGWDDDDSHDLFEIVTTSCDSHAVMLHEGNDALVSASRPSLARSVRWST